LFCKRSTGIEIEMQIAGGNLRAPVQKPVRTIPICHSEPRSGEESPTHQKTKPNGRSVIAPTNIHERDSELVGAVIDRPLCLFPICHSERISCVQNDRSLERD